MDPDAALLFSPDLLIRVFPSRFSLFYFYQPAKKSEFRP